MADDLAFQAAFGELIDARNREHHLTDPADFASLRVTAVVNVGTLDLAEQYYLQSPNIDSAARYLRAAMACEPKETERVARVLMNDGWSVSKLSQHIFILNKREANNG